MCIKLKNKRKGESLEANLCLGKREAVNKKRAVIVGDVFTTSSTINEIAEVLKTTGVESYFFTLASTPQIA